ncbi:hypothetical protein [Luteimonas sp. FCS-9]|uniref:hypothetical protein n=1 Tax=Luteimonas sp. FCS-9 TaxID=1547516 RepID=UPI000699810D|nr:hypothetical protein [Luteimonas sp. FCS-9]
MSNEAITWSLRIKLPPGNAPAKHLLFVLANQANGDPGRGVPMLSHPSIAYIADVTGMDRKTIVSGLQKLRDWGLITDTGRRVGRTGQVPVYELHTGPDLLDPIVAGISNSPENGTVPKSGPLRAVTVPNTDGNSPKYGTRNPRNLKAGEREGAGTRAEPISPPTEAGRACLLMRAAGASHTNPSHPDLLAAIAEGITGEVLADTVGEALDASVRKPFAWAIATARDRHRSGARPIASTSSTGSPHAAHRPTRESRSARIQRRNAQLDALESGGSDQFELAP